MTVDERYKYLKRIQKRYREADRAEKGRMLEEAIEVTELQRKTLIRLLGGEIKREPRQRQRGRTSDGRPIYSLADVYSQADLVTYPSAIEGFGNAFLEAVYYRRPLVVNNYPVYRSDIRPHGFRVIEFDDLVTEETVARVRALLQNPAEVDAMTEHNYELGRRHYSYRLLERRLAILLDRVLKA